MNRTGPGQDPNPAFLVPKARANGKRKQRNMLLENWDLKLGYPEEKGSNLIQSNLIQLFGSSENRGNGKKVADVVWFIVVAQEVIKTEHEIKAK